MNKRIFTYWQQGFHQAPGIVQACLGQMAAMNPGWEIVALDSQSIREYCPKRPIDEEIWQSLGRAHQSDLLRTQLLIDHGGVWMDPTVFCVRPLDDWLDVQMGGGVFFFQKPGPDRLISNWFIAAEPESLLLIKIRDRLIDFWKKTAFERRFPLPDAVERLLIQALSRHYRLSRLRVLSPWRRFFSEPAYMVYHYLCADLVLRDAEVKAIWARIPPVSAVPPHRLQRLGLTKSITSEGEGLLRGTDSPLFKLTWKDIPADPESNTLLARLYEVSQVPAELS